MIVDEFRSIEPLKRGNARWRSDSAWYPRMGIAG